MSRTLRFTVADDDHKFMFLVHYVLSRAFPGSSFALFSNAEDALHHIQHSGTDILVTDHAMGNITGTDLIRILRHEHNPLPVIMISGDESAEAPALAAGATEFVHKDRVLEHLAEHIKRYVPA